MLFLFLEGNIGVGKSYLINLLSNAVSKRKIVLIDEPVDRWIEVGLLKYYYENIKRSAFAFQLNVFKDLETQLQNAYNKWSDSDIVVVHVRSCRSCVELFSRQLKDTDNITDEEYDILKSLYETGFEKKLRDKHLVMDLYLKDSVDNCMEKIKLRGIDSEIENISENYLASIETKMDNMQFDQVFYKQKSCYDFILKQVQKSTSGQRSKTE